MSVKFLPLSCALPFSSLFFLVLLTRTKADMQPLQIIGTYDKIMIPPFSPACPDALRILQVDPLSTNEGVFFVISHNRIEIPLQGGGTQTCVSSPVNNPRFGNTSATLLKRDTQSTLDDSNPLVRAFKIAEERFFLGLELGPRVCGQAILPADSVSMWVAPDTIINVPAGTIAINFKPGFKYIYYFSETDPCLFRGNANEQGTTRPVPTPPSPSPTPAPSSVLLSPLPAPSQSPFPTTGGTSNVLPQDDTVTILQGPIETPGTACFPYDAEVETKHGAVPIGELKVGDDVLVRKGQYSNVFAFTHASRGVLADFVAISTSNRTVVLSHGHYIYANDRSTKAETVRIGDRVWDVDHGEVMVTNVENVRKRGLFNPQTVDGNIVVEGLIATTYTTALGEMMTAHALLAPIRVLRCLFPVDGLLHRILLLWTALSTKSFMTLS